MTDYDPNLPQEFAHMPKKHGLGAIMLIIAIVALFILGGLFASLRHRTPDAVGTTVAPPTPVATQGETNADTPAPPADAPSVDTPAPAADTPSVDATAPPADAPPTPAE